MGASKNWIDIQIYLFISSQTSFTYYTAAVVVAFSLFHSLRRRTQPNP